MDSEDVELSDFVITVFASGGGFNEVQLSNIRRCAPDQWKENPIVYAILRQMKHVRPLLDSGSDLDRLSDFSIPYERSQLPPCLRQDTDEFISLQDKVVSKLDCCHFGEEYKDRHYSVLEGNKLFLKSEYLGDRQAGSHPVDRVICAPKLAFARKIIVKYPGFDKNESVKDVENEIKIMRQLKHQHIVRLMGSYTDNRHIGLIMSPVAERNLESFLEAPLPTVGVLQRFFGCLAAAVQYLHQHEIQHRDIKPANILIKDSNVYLCDFGISKSWTSNIRPTTYGHVGGTLRYCAPELRREPGAPHNYKLDIWSLGCVFVEIWTVMNGRLLAAMSDHVSSKSGEERHSWCYHSSRGIVLEWIEIVKASKKRPTHFQETESIGWAKSMACIIQSQRSASDTYLAGRGL